MNRFRKSSSTYPLTRFQLRSRLEQNQPIAETSILPAFSTRALGA